MAGSSASLENELTNLDHRYLKLEIVFKQLESLIDKILPLVIALSEAKEDLASFSKDIDHIFMATKKFKSLIQDDFNNLKLQIKSKELNESVIQSIRHDLRAQVGAILGYSELLQEELNDSGDDQALKYTQILGMIVEKTKTFPSVIDALRMDDELEPEDYPTSAPVDNENLTLHETSPVYDPKYANSTVLIIDDSTYNREILTRRLTRYGVKILTAENGAVGLEMVSQNQIDLILLDIMMPIMNGYETLTHLKADEKTKNIPVLMISALSEVESIVRCIEAGAEDYLPTPFNPVVLHARIKTCLEKKLLRDREQEHLKQLELSRQRLATSIESMDDGFAVYGPDGKLSMCNRQFQELYPGVEVLGLQGFTYEELLRENYKLGVYFEERRRSSHQTDEVSDAEDWIQLFTARHNTLEAYLIQLSDGRWIEVTNSATPDGGMVSVHKDVTMRKKDEERLTYLALHDPLTGLANRSAFETRLDREFKNAQTENKGSFAVMFLDLDGFKGVNDRLGHEAGDRLLIQVAHSIQECIRAQDILARLGGDEFAILLMDETEKDALAIIATRIIEHLGTSFEYRGQAVTYGISIGIAIYPSDANSPEEFMKHSDMAMYATKKSGKGHFRFYSDLKST